MYRHDKPNEPTKKGPLSLNPHLLRFNSQQWPPLSSLSGFNQGEDIYREPGRHGALPAWQGKRECVHVLLI
jgi:hypothetical protein